MIARPKGKKRKEQPMNLEPMTVKVEMWDGDGKPVKVRTKVTDAKAGRLTVSHPPLEWKGKHRIRVSVTGTPRKGKKGKR